MLRFWTLKLSRSILTLWFVVTAVFIVLRVSGDPVQSLLPPDSTPEEIAYFRQAWGLDRPLIEQYIRYVANIAKGEFGKSYRDGRQVIDIIAERVPWTLMLGLTAFALSIVVGLPMGILAALKRNTSIDRMIMAVAVFGFALPNFFFGILLILLFSLTLRWLPSSGTGTVLHLLMPAATLGLATAGTLARFTRSAMLEVLGKVYMRAAAAKGVPFTTRLIRHALPNAAIPIVTIMGLNLGALVGGAIVVETVFAWPGIGRLLVTAVSARDLAVVQALVLLISITMVLANLTVDLLYGLLDPRIRVAKAG
jgi:peptide/nickel transport system permease protein